MPRDSGYKRAKNDWYVEERWAARQLIEAEYFFGTIWDPCAGECRIPDAIADASIRCHPNAERVRVLLASDIAQRSPRLQVIGDFFEKATVEWAQQSGPVTSIISNPPYGGEKGSKLDKAAKFWARAMDIADHKVALLLRLEWLEGLTRYLEIFSRRPPTRVHVSVQRISMPPGDAEVKAEGGTTAFAWFVWERGSSVMHPPIYWFTRPEGS